MINILPCCNSVCILWDRIPSGGALSGQPGDRDERLGIPGSAFLLYFFPKDDNLGIYVENSRRERGRASEVGPVPL